MNRLLFIALLLLLSSSAQAQDQGFLIENAEDDSLFYVAPDGYMEMGPSDRRITVGENGEGLISTVTTAAGHPSAGMFRIKNTESQAIALLGSTTGVGQAIFGFSSGSGTGVEGVNTGTGMGGIFWNNNEGVNPALLAESAGNGAAFIARRYSATDGHVALFATGKYGSTEHKWVAHVEEDGTIWTAGDIRAEGTITGSGADFAERFEVMGETADYQAGDVLVISTEADRHLAQAHEPYSSLVAGVYATRPGVVLADPAIAPESTVSVGVVGVIPTNVTSEGGPIRRGDLLVTSSTPGHAMKGDPARTRVGTVIGKALQNFDGESRGVIQVLVNVQ